MYKIKHLANPCRNFCILSCTAFTDPKDGVEKVAYVSFANHICGILYLMEPKSGAVEQYTLPLDNGAWAIYNHQNEALIIGTCAEHGCIHRFDLKSRTFAEPLTCGESYIWNFASDDKGFLYGGTYRNAKLVRYDLNAHKLCDLGALNGDTPENTYARYVAHFGEYILVDVGMKVPCTFAYRIADGEIKPAKEYGIAVTAESQLAPTDSRAQNRHCTLSDGTLIVFDGQDYLCYEKDRAVPVIRSIPGTPPTTGIFALTGDENGILYGASNFGMTMFRFDPQTKESWNSPCVDCTSGGEIYGMVVKDGLLYMTSYSGGRHIVYDPSKEWNSRGGVNPYLLTSVSPEYIRPHGRTVIGPKGDIWTGWYAKYGTYGGALSKIDATTQEVTCYPVGENAVASIASDGEVVYYATNGMACGLPYRDNSFCLAAVDADGRELRKITFPEKTRPNTVYVRNDKIYVGCSDACLVYEKDTFAPVAAINCPDKNVHHIAAFDGKLMLFCSNGDILALDPDTNTYEEIASTPTICSCSYLVGDTLYFGCGTELWTLTK